VISALSALAALRLALGDGSVSVEEGVQIAEATIGAAAVYTGIGIATPAEPNLKVRETPSNDPPAAA
jgi:hypothetical protein